MARRKSPSDTRNLKPTYIYLKKMFFVQVIQFLLAFCLLLFCWLCKCFLTNQYTIGVNVRLLYLFHLMSFKQTRFTEQKNVLMRSSSYLCLFSLCVRVRLLHLDYTSNQSLLYWSKLELCWIDLGYLLANSGISFIHHVLVMSLGKWDGLYAPLTWPPKQWPVC